MENHVASDIAKSGIEVKGGIIEQRYAFVIGGSGVFGLLVGNTSKGDEHGRVNVDGLVKLVSYDFLNKGD